MRSSEKPTDAELRAARGQAGRERLQRDFAAARLRDDIEL
jgi:hypothetical protein